MQEQSGLLKPKKKKRKEYILKCGSSVSQIFSGSEGCFLDRLKLSANMHIDVCGDKYLLGDDSQPKDSWTYILQREIIESVNHCVCVCVTCKHFLPFNRLFIFHFDDDVLHCTEAF